MTAGRPDPVRCGRCGRKAEPDTYGGVPGPPPGWSGTVDGAICPGCHLVELHPCCTGLVRAYTDDAVAPEVAAAFPEGMIEECGHIDRTVTWIQQADWPTAWRCPRCGSTEFMGVTDDYGRPIG